MAGASLPQGIAYAPMCLGGALILLFALERLLALYGAPRRGAPEPWPSRSCSGCSPLLLAIGVSGLALVSALLATVLYLGLGRDRDRRRRRLGR